MKKIWLWLMDTHFCQAIIVLSNIQSRCVAQRYHIRLILNIWQLTAVALTDSLNIGQTYRTLPMSQITDKNTFAILPKILKS